MSKNSYFLAQVEKAYEKKLAELRLEYEARLAQEQHFLSVFQLDMVTLALGRMGFREKRFRQFDQALAEAQAEFISDAHTDMKDDPDIWYSKGKLDQELQQYTGSLFVPFEKRYDWEDKK